MTDKKLAKHVKKLFLQNRFTLEDISIITGKPIEECAKEYQEYYNLPISSSMFIVGNQKSRKTLLECIRNAKPCLLIGPNGVGKTSAVRDIAKSNGLTIKRAYPLSQKELVKEFMRGPYDPANNNLYVVEADALNNKKYSVLKKYVKDTKRPFVVIANSKKTLNSRITKKLKIIKFLPPTPEDVEIFLRKKYNWDGNIYDVYDPDMRLVLNRVLGDKDLIKPNESKTINARDCAIELSYGYFKKEGFEELDQPIWWVIRWLAYNQNRKFRHKKDILKNLLKLSYIDSKKFTFSQTHIENMLLNLKGSPRRVKFKFPPWTSKETKEEEIFKPFKEKPETTTKVDISSWL